MLPNLPDHINAKIMPEPNSGCWLWMGSWNNEGYGLGPSTPKGWPEKAYRITYQAVYGPIPADLEIDHKCRVRCCVNPDHLQAVSHQENMRRSLTVGRHPRRGTEKPPPRLSGEQCSWAKLTKEKANQIRLEYAATGQSQKTVAKRFGVSQMTVSLIVQGKRWQ